MKHGNCILNRIVCILLMFCMITTYFFPPALVRAEDTGAVLWVDPVNGNDASSGLTESAALKTIQTAATIAAQMSESSNVTVYLKGGTYAYGETIYFGATESGKNGNIITYKSAAGETAIISGGTTLDGWTLHDADKNIYVTDIPEGTELSRQLYVNGDPVPNAYTESPTDWILMRSGGYMSPYVDSANSNEYLIADLGETKLVSSVVLYAGSKADANGKAAGFPRDFTISTSKDGINWENHVTEANYNTPAIEAYNEFVFGVVAARYIKLNVTELGSSERLNPGKYNLSISEMAIGMESDDSVADLMMVQHLDLQNNLLSADMVRAGYYSGGGLESFVDYTHSATAVSNVVDGNVATYLSTGAQRANWLTGNGGSNTIAYLFELGDIVSIGAVELTVRSADICCPIDFEIQASEDGTTWTTVISEQDYDWSGNLTALFTFNSRPAAFLRIVSYETTPEGSNYYVQFSEAAVYRPADIAAGAVVQATSDDKSNSGWGSEYLANGAFDGTYTSTSFSNATAVTAPVTLDLGESHKISGVCMYPRYTNGEAVQYVTAVRFSVSEDNVAYETVMELTNISAPSDGGAQLFIFPEIVNSRYIRIEPLEIHKGESEPAYRFQLREIEVAPASYSLYKDEEDGPELKTEIAYTPLNLTTDDILQLGHVDFEIYASASIAQSYPASNLVDGDDSTVALTDSYRYEWLSSHGGSYTLSLVVNTGYSNDSTSTIGAIRLAPRSNGLCAPVNFDIKVMNSDGELETVLSVTDEDWSNSTAKTYTFDPVEASLVYVCATKINPENTGITWEQIDANPSGYVTRLGFAEVDVYQAEERTVQTKLELTSSDVLRYENANANNWNEIGGGTSNTTPASTTAANIVDGSYSTNAQINQGLHMAWTTAYVPCVELDVTQTDGAPSLVNQLTVVVREDLASAPISFDVQIADANDSWTTVLEVTEHLWEDSNVASFTFTPVEAYKLRMVATQWHGNSVLYPECGTGSDSTGQFKICEIEVYAVEYADGYTPIPEPVYNAIALDVEQALPNIGHYSDKEMLDFTDTEYWSAGNAIDGDLNTSAITLPYQYTSLTDFGGLISPAFVMNIADTNGNPASFNGVELTVRNTTGTTAPYHFVIQANTDSTGENWTTVLEVNNKTWADNRTSFYSFNQVEAYKLRLIAFNLCPEDKNSWTMDDIKQNTSDYTYSRLGISEITLYNVVDVANPVPAGVVTQGYTGTTERYYDVANITAHNDNGNVKYNAYKAVDGTVTPTINYGWVVPESYGFAEIGNVTDVEIHFLGLWQHKFEHIDGISGNGTEIYATTNGWRPTWIANAYEFIDTVGEWYIDRNTCKIYYKAADTMENVEVVLPVVEQIIDMKGASNITFDGIVFEHSSYVLPSIIGYADAQANTHSYNGWHQVDGGIMIDSCENITITNSVIRNMGSAGIKVRSMESISNDVQITNNQIYDISYSGIIVGEVYKHSGYESWQLVTNTLIRNNYITRIGIDMFDSPGITVTYTNGTIIDHNEVAYCPYSGISTGWGWCNEVEKETGNAIEEVGNLQITNNYIHDTGKTNRDGGSIYNLGTSKDTVISGNYIYNSWDGDDTYEMGIYLDEGSSWMEICNNVIGENVHYWMNQWQASIKENYWHDNFYHADVGMRDDGTDTVYENNTAVEDGNFEAFPGAMTIINNAGLLTDALKTGVANGFAPEHDIVQEMYHGISSRYIEGVWGWSDVSIEGQSSNTMYDSAIHEITIYVPSGTDVTALPLSFTLEDGFSCNRVSGSTQNFTEPVEYTLSKGSETVVWTVAVKIEVEAGGEIVGTEVTLDDAIADSSNWTVAPSATTENSLTFNTYSGYIGERFENDTIFTFDMTAELYESSKDWLQISLRNQDPYVSCISGGTEYNIGFNHDNIEVQKFVDGERTVLYGVIDGYEAVFGNIPNEFFTSGERHSITVGAVDVEGGVRLFLFVDGNQVFDIIDSDNPIAEEGFFAVYGMTHAITLSSFTDIQE